MKIVEGTKNGNHPLSFLGMEQIAEQYQPGEQPFAKMHAFNAKRPKTTKS